MTRFPIRKSPNCSRNGVSVLLDGRSANTESPLSCPSRDCGKRFELRSHFFAPKRLCEPPVSSRYVGKFGPIVVSEVRNKAVKLSERITEDRNGGYAEAPKPFKGPFRIADELHVGSHSRSAMAVDHGSVGFWFVDRTGAAPLRSRDKSRGPIVPGTRYRYQVVLFG